MGERSQREAGRCAIISDLVTCSGMTPSPVDTLCASQANGLSPCSAAPFLSHRQAPSPLHTQPHTLPHTHTYSHTNTHNLPRYSNTPHTPSLTLTYSSHTLIHHSHTAHILHTHTYTLFTPSHTQIHKLLTHTYTLTHSSHTHTHTLLIPSHTHTLTQSSPAHIHTHTHTNTSTKPTGAQTQETRGPRGSAHTPGTWSMWEQPRVPAGVSRWNLHTLGATGTLEAPRGQVRQPRGLRLTQLCPDQNSLLCRICHYDQWIPHRRWTSLHSRSTSFSVKNTKTAAPQLQTPFPSPRPALPATDPGKRGSSYLDHPPRC